MATSTEATSRRNVKDRVQIQNPATLHYVKVDTRTGRILEEKKTKGPYKGIREIAVRKK